MPGGPQMPPRTNTANRRMLTQTEAADWLGVTERTIRSYVARGLLKAYRVQGSRLVRIRRDDLEGLLTPIPTTGEN